MTPNFPFLEKSKDDKIILKKFKLYLLPLQQQDDLVFVLSLSPFDQHAHLNGTEFNLIVFYQINGSFSLCYMKHRIRLN